MADGYVDLSPVISSINSAMSGLSSDINSIRYGVDSLRSDVDARMSVVQNDLETLKKDFQEMMAVNERRAALQLATTEIIRVRQELERDFGQFKEVRKHMLGILQATDHKLVRQSTITTRTEELMIATPGYWLAPVLIALSAWIADDKDLANRALKVALNLSDSSKEKTCLTFALICRRNKRTDACFAWLKRYFEQQSATDMKESIVAYIDAYTNGVFGVDKDNLCTEYINKWMKELKDADPEFDQKQRDYWKQFYQTYCEDTTPKYSKLAECASDEFSRMNEYVQRINAAPAILLFFADILSTEVDHESLVKTIDDELTKLVTNYDEKEAPLREEEEYYADVKMYKGDEKRANALRAVRKLTRMDREVNLAQRLSENIISTDPSKIASKKTSIRFMQDYITGAFKEFIEEKAPAYPQEVTIKTHGWSGKTTDGSNKQELVSSYESTVNGRRSEKLATVKKGGIIACGVIALLLVIAAIVGFAVDGLLWLGVIGVLGALGLGVLAIVLLVKNKKKKAEINAEFDTILRNGTSDINISVAQLIEMNSIALNFNPAESCEKLLLTEGK